jgi:hypothetical protein
VRPVTAEIRQFQASMFKILVNDVPLGQVFLRVLRLYPVSAIRPMLHIHSVRSLARSLALSFVRSFVRSFIHSLVTVDIKHPQLAASFNNSLKL